MTMITVNVGLLKDALAELERLNKKKNLLAIEHYAPLQISVLQAIIALDSLIKDLQELKEKSG